MLKEFFVSDIHFPFHDKAAYHIFLKIVMARNPDVIHIGGDGVDFHSISRHPKAMIDRTILKHEVDGAKRELARMRTAAGPNTKINFQEGNHDKRMAVFLRDRAPELSDLFELTFPKLLGLAELNIRWIPDTEKFKIGKLYHHHGHLLSGGGVSPARAKFNKLYQNVIFGHHHKFDYYSVRQYGTNELFQSIANANLYGIEAEYAHHTNWNLGFTEIDYAKSGDFSVSQIQITRRPDGVAYAIVDGTVYESTDDEDIDKFLKLNAKALARKGASKARI